MVLLQKLKNYCIFKSFNRLSRFIILFSGTSHILLLKRLRLSVFCVLIANYGLFLTFWLVNFFSYFIGGRCCMRVKVIWRRRWLRSDWEQILGRCNWPFEIRSNDLASLLLLWIFFKLVHRNKRNIWLLIRWYIQTKNCHVEWWYLSEIGIFVNCLYHMLPVD